MEYKRAFCFGDSYTYYTWPTWADILRKDLGIPLQNWGMNALGNTGIFCRMVQCNVINKFTDEDLIIVIWSGWTREDRYLNGKWTCHGNVHVQPKSSIYNDHFINKFWDWSNDIIKNSTAIISANKMFNIFGNFSIVPMNNLNEIKVGDGKTQKEWNEANLIKLYLEDFPNIKLFKTPKSKIHDIAQEQHPDIIAHGNFVKDEIYSKLGITMKSTTEKDIQLYQNDLLNELRLLNFAKSKRINDDIMKNRARSIWEKNNWEKYPHQDWQNELKTWKDLEK